MKTFHAFALIALVFTSMTASAIPRKDKLECGLPDGSKFILVAKYDWEPLARILPANVAERLNQGPFDVYFQQKKTSRKIEIESLTVSHQPLDELKTSEKLCQSFGLKNGVPYGGARYFLPLKDKSFVKIKFDEKLVLSRNHKKSQEKIRSEIEKLSAYSSVGAITLVNNQLVSERALIDVNEMVIAVFKSQSHDNGKTWRDPIITTQAEIFELGKPVQEQSFIARPIKINGRKVRANFPSPQKE